MRVYLPKWKDPKTGKARDARTWVIEFVDHTETRRKVMGFRDKRQTEALGRQIERLVSMRVSGEPVFAMPDKPVKLVQADLKAARAAWLREAGTDAERKRRSGLSFLKYRDSAGRVADFHALRHTYIWRLVASGANIKVCQELARHSTPMLTLGRYAHIQLVDPMRALEALPNLSTPAPPAAVPATGTHG